MIAWSSPIVSKVSQACYNRVRSEQMEKKFPLVPGKHIQIQTKIDVLHGELQPEDHPKGLYIFVETMDRIVLVIWENIVHVRRA